MFSARNAGFVVLSGRLCQHTVKSKKDIISQRHPPSPRGYGGQAKPQRNEKAKVLGKEFEKEPFFQKGLSQPSKKRGKNKLDVFLRDLRFFVVK